MRVELEEGAWILDEIGDVEWFMLAQLPQAADYRQSEKGHKRLLPEPVGDPEAIHDWKAYVQPGIESQFQEQIQTVADDIDEAQEFESEIAGEDGPVILHRLRVDVDRTETWYSVLNQARIILNEEHDISETEQSLFIGEQNPTEIDEQRWLTMVQYRIYGAIQEFLLTHLME